ncbi:MAG: hypothetical protein HY553_15790 [Elusimicrobia bacterium]|nr:hypothetical protein [Elusimicrobiota bacterium]
MRALAAVIVCLAASRVAGQEWYIPKRQTLLTRGSGEIGTRLQLSANNDGLLDTLRLEAVPHLRFAPLRRLEVYTELPFSYAEREDVVNFNLVKNDTTGIGDAFAQLSLEGFSGEDWKVLYNLDGSFPTGKSPYRHRVSLGSGHFAAALGQTAMKVIDPLVLFMHLGYQHVFPRRTIVGRVSPGRSIRFRFGTALALNPRVQTTLHVTGDAINTTRINGSPTPGSSGTLLRFGWGLDWTMLSRLRWSFDAAFGMTKNTPDATLSTGWSIRF